MCKIRPKTNHKYSKKYKKDWSSALPKEFFVEVTFVLYGLHEAPEITPFWAPTGNVQEIQMKAQIINIWVQNI